MHINESICIIRVSVFSFRLAWYSPGVHTNGIYRRTRKCSQYVISKYRTLIILTMPRYIISRFSFYGVTKLLENIGEKHYKSIIRVNLFVKMAPPKIKVSFSLMVGCHHSMALWIAHSCEKPLSGDTSFPSVLYPGWRLSRAAQRLCKLRESRGWVCMQKQKGTTLCTCSKFSNSHNLSWSFCAAKGILLTCTWFKWNRS